MSLRRFLFRLAHPTRQAEAVDSEWKFVHEFEVQRYQCGLVAGDRLRIIQDIVIRTYDEVPTGKVYRAGEVWTVLKGSRQDPGVVFLRQQDGRTHTWDDDPTLFETFAKVDPS